MLYLQVIEELFTYWNLDDADETLEELEDALIVSASRGRNNQSLQRWARRRLRCSALRLLPPTTLKPQMSDFGPKTAFKIVDGIREKVCGCVGETTGEQ